MSRPGYVSLSTPGCGDYDIATNRMETPAEVLGWVLHLSGKTWITKEHIAGLIEVAIKLGVRVDR